MYKEIKGKVGLGLRREFAKELLELEEGKPAFVEFAPENWMGFGGYWRTILDKVHQQFPITTHGLSLSIGSPDDLEIDFIKRLKAFLDEFDIDLYSEHLSYSKCANAHLYDLLPIPFRKDAVDHIVERISIVQDLLKRPITLENVSYYTPLGAEMTEVEFVSDIVKKSGCKLLLDINNVYVNAFNHNYDAKEFIQNLPLSEVGYIHMAGHEQVSEDLIIDTHGQAIIDPVFELFEWALPKIEPVPILLERDFNIPEMDILKKELYQLQTIANKAWIKDEQRIKA